MSWTTKIARFARHQVSIDKIASLFDILLLLAFTGVTLAVHGAGIGTIGDMVLSIWFTRVPLVGCLGCEAVLWLLFAQMCVKPILCCLSVGAWIIFAMAAVSVSLVSLGIDEHELNRLVFFLVTGGFRCVIFGGQVRQLLSSATFRTSDLIVFLTLVGLSLGVVLSRWDHSAEF